MKENKKILIITKHFPPEIDGVGDHSYQLAKRLDKEGHDIEIVTATEGVFSEFKTYKNKLDGFFCLNPLKNIIISSQPDVIIFQYVPFSYHQKGLPFWLVSFFYALKGKKINVFLFVHETFERRRVKLKHILLEHLQRSILFSLCSLSKHIFTTNILYKQHLLKYVRKLTLTPTPSNFEGSKGIFKKINQENLGIVVFGNRNPTLILPLLVELQKKNQNLHITFVGKTSSFLSDKLSTYPYKKILPHITLTGIIPPSKIIEYLSNADFYLLPEEVLGNSKMGGLSTKSGSTATAFMLGKIVVTTSGDMTAQIFNDLHNCVFTDNYSHSANAEKIIQVYNHTAVKRKIEENAELLYEQNLSWEHTIRPILNELN